MDAFAATSLIDRKLDGFTVQKYTEVYETDADDLRTGVLGYFKNEAIAKAFAGNLTAISRRRTQEVLLLTDGKTAFFVREQVELMGDEKEKFVAIQSARAKLSPAELKLLGL